MPAEAGEQRNRQLPSKSLAYNHGEAGETGKDGGRETLTM